MKYSLEGVEVYLPLKLDFTEQITFDYISHFGIKKPVIDFILK